MLGTKTAISILIQQPAPSRVKQEYKHKSLEQKVCEYIKKVQGNISESEYEWSYLKKVYEHLSRRPKLNHEHEQILNLLEPVLEKFANHDSSESVNIDAQFMHRGKS